VHRTKKAEDRLLAEEQRKCEENATARTEVSEKQQMDLRVREIERQMAKDKAEKDRRNSHHVVLGTVASLVFQKGGAFPSPPPFLSSPPLLSPPLPFRPPFPSSPLTFPPLPLEVGPLNPARSGGAL